MQNIDLNSMVRIPLQNVSGWSHNLLNGQLFYFEKSKLLIPNKWFGSHGHDTSCSMEQEGSQILECNKM